MTASKASKAKDQEWVYVGSLPDTIAGGHHVAHGDPFKRTYAEDGTPDPHEQMLEDAGHIIPAPAKVKLDALTVAELDDVIAARLRENPELEPPGDLKEKADRIAFLTTNGASA